MSTNTNPISVTYSDEKLRILVEEYITMQKKDFTFKGVCSYILYRAMEEERAKNFQRMIVKRLNELEALKPETLNLKPENQPCYQLIFATSNIAEELNTAEYVVGDYYTQSNKSLKHV